MTPLLQPGKRIHLVGIGGIGLSAIARVLHGLGYQVSGSDQQRTDLTGELIEEGIPVRQGHRADWVTGADLVVVSSAVPDSNAEIIEAGRLGIPVVKREQILGELTDEKITIAVAGAHGKTTTSAMIAWILDQAGLDPTYIVGGVLQNLGTNARAGTGPHFVIEADEYDRAFLGIRPNVAVVTVLEHDHPDCYPTFEEMRAAFRDFAEGITSGGLLIVCGEDVEARQLGESFGGRGRRVKRYGLDRRWDWWADGDHLGNHAIFEIGHRTGGKNGKKLGTCALQVPGRHNVLNALAALAASIEAGVDFDTAAAALTRFQGTARRFEFKGQADGVTVVDDYAHHPTEVRATLAAAHLKYPGRPIWAVFQPHTYSRTAALLDDFSAAFGDADHVVVTSIYAAREQNRLGISGNDLVVHMDHPDASYAETLDLAVSMLMDRIESGDVVITLGAGDGYLIGERVLERIKAGGNRNNVGREAVEPAPWGSHRMGIDSLRQALAGKNNSRQPVMKRQTGQRALPASVQGGNLAASGQREDVDRLATVLKKALGAETVKVGTPLARYTALRVGGPADLLVTAAHVETLRQSVMLAREHGVPCRVLGGGSNVLVSDQGIRGLVILNRTRAIDFSRGGVKAASGVSFSTLAQRCISRERGGLEWATGIPGTVGGAVVGNAGAWGSNVAATLIQATVMEPSGGVLVWPVERFDYGYRTSVVKRQSGDSGLRTIVLEAEFALEHVEAEALAKRAATISTKRKASQPRGATCGSVFKNPPDDYAGRRIEEAGLKGTSSGGVQISPLHANFFVNLGHATANDIRKLIDLAHQTVLERFGVSLELEIQLIGEW